MGSCWARQGHGMGHVRFQVQFTTQCDEQMSEREGPILRTLFALAHASRRISVDLFFCCARISSRTATMQMDWQNHILVHLGKKEVRVPMVLGALVTRRAKERNTQTVCERQRCTRCEKETACQWRAAQTPPCSQRRALPKRTAPTEKRSRIPLKQKQAHTASPSTTAEHSLPQSTAT